MKNRILTLERMLSRLFKPNALTQLTLHKPWEVNQTNSGLLYYLDEIYDEKQNSKKIEKDFVETIFKRICKLCHKIHKKP